jgi:triosephosphate isomerase (TIM)
MRRPIVAGNWKMNKTVAEATISCAASAAGSMTVKGHRPRACARLSRPCRRSKTCCSATQIGLGAQNMHWEDKGAYTGEVSPLMLRELCQYVILGHSERRAYFGETDEAVNRKIKAALQHGLRPIVCVGETESQYDAGQTERWSAARCGPAWTG